MIEYRKIEEEKVQVYTPDNKLVGFCTKLELLDIQCQIKKEKAEGYFIFFNTKRVLINLDGTIDNWPKGLFDLTDHYYKILFDF